MLIIMAQVFICGAKVSVVVLECISVGFIVEADSFPYVSVYGFDTPLQSINGIRAHHLQNGMKNITL